MMAPVSIWWLRRDLRLSDNTALSHAIKSRFPVLPVFIFDKNILCQLPGRSDRRVAFIRLALLQMQKQLEAYGSSLYIIYDSPVDAFERLCNEFDIREVYTNHDYEPYAQKRDLEVSDLLQSKRIPFHTFRDQVIFEKNDILKPDGKPYTVFTPYANAWKQKHQGQLQSSLEYELNNLVKVPPFPVPSLAEIGFEEVETADPVFCFNEKLMEDYAASRDFPAKEGTTRLGVHLRFGTVSVRQVALQAQRTSARLLDELIWREFYMMILFHYPQVVHQCFKRKYDNIKWRNNEREFALWCKGETGYAIVDAGMRQLNETGWMHNRVRMVVASFLSKHLLIDWRWGEAYFAEKLLDYELASNNGNWQWAAGSGCDAAPYFRIFNPMIQQKKFDPDEAYIRTWIRDYKPGYLPVVVEHDFARKRALTVYRDSLQD